MMQHKLYLCFCISAVLPFWIPILSAGLSLQRRLIKSLAPFPLGNRFAGNETASMPFKMMLYVFNGSLPVKGGDPKLMKTNNYRFKKSISNLFI